MGGMWVGGVDARHVGDRCGWEACGWEVRMRGM